MQHRHLDLPDGRLTMRLIHQNRGIYRFGISNKNAPIDHTNQQFIRIAILILLAFFAAWSMLFLDQLFFKALIAILLCILIGVAITRWNLRWARGGTGDIIINVPGEVIELPKNLPMGGRHFLKTIEVLVESEDEDCTSRSSRDCWVMLVLRDTESFRETICSKVKLLGPGFRSEMEMAAREILNLAEWSNQSHEI